MEACGHKGRCRYFDNRAALPLGSWQSLVGTYCNGDPSRCARWMVHEKLGASRIPDDLRPHERARAAELIASVMYN